MPALAVHTDQQLTAALGGVVDMPVVPAAGFKGDVGNENGLLRDPSADSDSFADEILGVACVLLTKTEEAAMILRLADIGVDLFCHSESRPCIGPACVKGDMGQNLRHLRLGDAVIFGALEMVLKGTVDNALCRSMRKW